MAGPSSSLEDVVAGLREQPLFVPDELAQHYGRRGGFEPQDVATTRLVALGAQKFMEDVIRDTLQLAKSRRNLPEAKLKAAGYNPKDKRLVLTTDDLAQALKEYGVNLRMPPYIVGQHHAAGGAGAAAAGR